MKIGFIDYVFDHKAPIGTNGLSEVVWNLAGPLAKLGCEVHVAGPYERTDYPSEGVQVHPYKIPKIWLRNIVGHNLIVRRGIKTLQRYGPFAVYHAPEYLSTALLTFFGKGTPVVLTEPGNIYERIANGNPYDPITTQVFKLAANRTAHSAARVIATSDIMQEWWQRTGTAPARIARIPLGVDLGMFEPVAGAKSQLGWSDTQQHLLFTARLSVETGAQYLLEALPEVLAKFPQVYLHLVGSGVAEDSLRQQAVDLKINESITWHGWLNLEELPLYYSAADVMVFPGTSGGTPRVMLQAMACGTPFVGAAIGGIVDHITPERGWLVLPRDTKALATAIVEVLSNPQLARQKAEQGIAYVQTLSWAKVAERVLNEVYCPLIADRE